MGVHESQSLFWECRVGRSHAFAARWHPRFCAGLAADPWAGAFGFWRSLNPLTPGLIRVEADELSYCLHIVLRFELELALLEQDLPVHELPQQWNRRMQDLLGLQPPTDAQGCLQDIHWAEGLFGYFPSYALGHLISAQLAETMEHDLGGPGSLEAAIARGSVEPLQRWLAASVWPLGRSVNAEQLVQRISGAPLSPRPFLAYLKQKLERLRTGPRLTP
jgi:carboxypeptidase Taq